MKASQPALTMVELLVIVAGVLLIAAFIVLPWLARGHEEARKDNCEATLKGLGKAMAAYRADNNGYFPFSWQRAGEAEPVGIGAANGAMAATSLGNLYPRYVKDAKLFRCPSTEDQSSFVLNLPQEYRSVSGALNVPRPPPSASNWTLVGNQEGRACSYCYDPRIAPRDRPLLWVLADADGYLGNDRGGPNHEGGQNVLFADGHVNWSKGTMPPYFSWERPFLEEFMEHKWDADTDSYLVDTDAALGVSFDGCKHLHYPQKAKPSE